MTLVETIKQAFGNDFTSYAAEKYSEPQQSISKYLEAGIPLVLSGIFQYAHFKGPGSLQGLAAEYVQSGYASKWTPADWKDAFHGIQTRGGELASTIFGSRQSEINTTLQKYAGIKAESATALLSITTPVAIGFIGAQIANLHDHSAIAAWMNEHVGATRTAIPVGLAISGLGLGGGSNQSGGSNVGEDSKLENQSVTSTSGLTQSFGSTPSSHEVQRDQVLNTAGAVDYESSTSAGKVPGSISSPDPESYKHHSKAISLVFWLLLLITGFMAVYYFLDVAKVSPPAGPANTFMPETLNPGDVTVTVASSKSAVGISEPVSAETIKRESLKVKLPDGIELNAYKGGIEDQLVAFLNDANAKVSKNKWFDFDDLNFETGSSDLTFESRKQIANIQAILKAYPKVKVKVGGYTDKTGGDNQNQKLSQSRAETVSAALKFGGADANQIIGAQGYGSEFAEADVNGPDHQKAMDRRISLSVREK